jgi:hypothetical protein
MLHPVEEVEIGAVVHQHDGITALLVQVRPQHVGVGRQLRVGHGKLVPPEVGVEDFFDDQRRGARRAEHAVDSAVRPTLE